MKQNLNEGDTIIVTSFSRLARSTKDLLDLVETFKNKIAGFKSLKK